MGTPAGPAKSDPAPRTAVRPDGESGRAATFIQHLESNRQAAPHRPPVGR